MANISGVSEKTIGHRYLELRESLDIDFLSELWSQVEDDALDEIPFYTVEEEQCEEDRIVFRILE